MNQLLKEATLEELFDEIQARSKAKRHKLLLIAETDEKLISGGSGISKLVFTSCSAIMSMDTGLDFMAAAKNLLSK